MLKQGYWLVEFISISSVINQAQARYERSFLLAQVTVLQQAIANLHAYLERKANEVAVLQRRLEGMDGLDHRQLALLRHALRHAGFRYTVLPHQNPSPDCDLPMAGPGGAPRWPDPDRQDPR